MGLRSTSFCVPSKGGNQRHKEIMHSVDSFTNFALHENGIAPSHSPQKGISNRNTEWLCIGRPYSLLSQYHFHLLLGILDQPKPTEPIGVECPLLDHPHVHAHQHGSQKFYRRAERNFYLLLLVGNSTGHYPSQDFVQYFFGHCSFACGLDALLSFFGKPRC